MYCRATVRTPTGKPPTKTLDFTRIKRQNGYEITDLVHKGYFIRIVSIGVVNLVKIIADNEGLM